MAATAVDVAGKLAAEGFDAIAATATWVHPVPEGLVALIEGARLVITVEDGLVDAGIGEEWASCARSAGVEAEFRHFGVPRRFLDHASRAQIIGEVGLDAAAIADSATAALNA
jgi:1-deoxy-D-xylulose-5-phosphate synthase